MIQRLRAARHGDESGFTLVELLIVIVVLGILAGIVVFGVGTFRTDSETATCKADVKTVSVASDAWNAKYGDFKQRDAAGAPTAADISAAYLVTQKYMKGAPSTATAISATGAVSATCGGALYTV